MEIGLFFMCLGRPPFDLVLNCVYRCKRLNQPQRKLQPISNLPATFQGASLFFLTVGRSITLYFFFLNYPFDAFVC